MGVEDLELEECWRDIRPRAQSLTSSWHPPPRRLVEEWATTLGSKTNPLLAVKGPSLLHRMEVYRWICPGEPGEWLGSPREYLSARTAGPNWNLLWDLLDVQDFVVEEPLRGLIDQGFLFTEFYQALWEARFLLQESTLGVGALVEALIRWMTLTELGAEDRKLLGRLRLSRPLQSDEERLDTLFFLLALARQNGTMEPTVVVFDELGKAVRAGVATRRKVLAELLKLVSAAERWNRLGAAIGIVVGFEPGVLTSLRRYNPKLAKKVSRSLVVESKQDDAED